MLGFCVFAIMCDPMKPVLLFLIRLYQLTLSAVMGRQCRFLPTCSDYARQAIEIHGVAKGGKLALKRIVRCHPWGGEGFDPVPPKDCGCSKH
jgi:uncharacterized protein